MSELIRTLGAICVTWTCLIVLTLFLLIRLMPEDEDFDGEGF